MKYPARIITEKDGFSTIFVDFSNAFTQGNTIEELKDNAQDVLSMAIKHCLDKDRAVPPPSLVEGDDIIWVEPYPEIRQRMGHKKDCECPLCQNARGERKRTKVSRGFFLSPVALNKLSLAAKEQKISQNVLLEKIIMESLE